MKNLEEINDSINKNLDELNDEKIPYTKLFSLIKTSGISNKDFEDTFQFSNDLKSDNDMQSMNI